MRGWALSAAILLFAGGCGIGLIGMDPPLLECKEAPTCGQCISNPGCGWCGCRCVDAKNGDVTQKPGDCTSEYVYEFGKCPVLPQSDEVAGDKPIPGTTEEEDEGLSPYEEALGDETYEQMRTGIKWAIRNPRAQVDDDMVDGVLRAMDQFYPDAMDDVQDLDTSPFGSPPPLDDEKRYYTVTPIHSRTGHAEPESKFQQPVPMARYRLPAEGQETIQTELGKAYPGDRKFNNLKDVENRVKPTMGWAPKRVDVISGIRWLGRFAPVTLYLCYREPTSPLPEFYMLEAGLATGQSRTVYLSKTMDGDVQIQAQGMYEPTAFSSNAHWYNARLQMKGDEPTRIDIYSGRTKNPDDAYIHLTMRYRSHGTDAPRNVVAYKYLLEACARIAAIGEALCVDTGFGIFQKPMAKIGMTSLKWLRKPVRKGAPCKLRKPEK